MMGVQGDTRYTYVCALACELLVRSITAHIILKYLQNHAPVIYVII